MIKEEQTDNHRLAEETDTSIAVSIEGTTACNTIAVQQIEQKIFVVRGQQVILDRDLAILYDVETAQLNRQVKRNIQQKNAGAVAKVQQLQHFISEKFC